MPTKETLCTRCVHLQVCCFKNIYLDVVKAIDSIEVSYGPINDNKDLVIKVPNITWLRPIEPVCVNYVEKKRENKVGPVGLRG